MARRASTFSRLLTTHYVGEWLGERPGELGGTEGECWINFREWANQHQANADDPSRARSIALVTRRDTFIDELRARVL